VALGLAGLQRLRAAVDATGVKTIVSFVLRWNPLFQVIRSLLDSGTVGAFFCA
jgi:predicted dehydrogenase